MIREEQESAIQQMIDAPKYSFYICEDISYFKELASTINRDDLKIHRLPFLDTQGWRGTHHHVIVDYALYLPLKLHNEIFKHNLQIDEQPKQDRKWIIEQALKLMDISVRDELDFPIKFASAYKMIYDRLYK